MLRLLVKLALLKNQEKVGLFVLSLTLFSLILIVKCDEIQTKIDWLIVMKV